MNDNAQPDRVAIIANPSSGAGKNRARVDRLAAALGTHGLVAECCWDPAEEARLFADPERRASYRCVVAAGGDGTVNRVLNSGAIPPLVVFPLGTENLFAKHYDYPGDAAGLATRIALGSVRTIDLARMGERTFALVVSAGFDAEVIHRMDRWRRDGHAVKQIRHLSYARPILAALREYRHPTVQLQADGQNIEGTLAMVLNLPIYVRRLVPVPDGREDDGLLDWPCCNGCPIHPLTRPLSNPFPSA